MESQQVEEENNEMQMNVQVGGSTFAATLEENEGRLEIPQPWRRLS